MVGSSLKSVLRIQRRYAIKECSQEAQCLACVGDGWLQAQLKLPGHDTMEVAERALQK